MAIHLSEKQKKEGWQVVKFGEIAIEAKRSTKAALEDGLEFYVGLEHLDPQSLRIQRKGVIADDDPSFTRLFKPGQILFGKRRCYQKKAAVADFEGICSGDIIVMEAIPGKIIPELLPFIVQSDMFFDWAEKTSSGSLSPRTKWKALAEFEFPLPPLERQKKILEVLEKVKTIDEKVRKTKDQLSKLLDGFYRDYLAKKLKIEEVPNRPLMIESCTPTKKLNELINGKIQNGLFIQNGVTHRNKAIFLNVQDIYVFPPKTVDALVSVTCTDKDLTSFKLKTGDVIYNRSSFVKDGIGWAYLCTDINRETVYDCHLMRVTPKDELLPEYLLLYSISPWARKYFMCISQTTTMTTIGQVELGSLPIPFPNMELQLEIVKSYQAVVQTVEIAEKKQRNVKTLNTQIISKLLGNNGGVK